MRWTNPAAFLGLALAVVPVLAHLLTRYHARVLPFPTLRFLPRTPLVPTRLTRPTDLPLLLVRMAIIAAAVAALAQPQWLIAPAAADSSGVARVVMVDTSASMSSMLSRRTIRDSALQLAGRIGDSSDMALIMTTEAPAVSLPAAASWLSSTRNSASREIVIVSDFQQGTVYEAAINAIPAEIGLRFVQILPPAVDSVRDIVAGGYSLTMRLADSATSVRMTRTPDTASLAAVPALHAAASEADLTALRRLIGSASRAGRVDTAPPASGGSRFPSTSIEVAFPGSAAYAEWPAMPDGAFTPLQVQAMHELRSDSTLVRAARLALVAETLAVPRGIVLLQSAHGRPAVMAYPGASPSELRLVVHASHRAPLALALLSSAAALHGNLTPSELETRFIDADALRQWERPASAVTRDSAGNSGRWVWLLVLLLLGVEWVLRRGANTPAAGPGAQLKVAA